MPGGSAQAPVDHGDHAVQFYGDDDELAASVGGFLGHALAEGGSAVVVATPAHRAAFAGALGFAGGTAMAAGRLIMADAAALLDGFLAGDRLDTARFRAAALDLTGRAARAGQPVRIYAEMVALLWDAGRVALALELEARWNDLARQLPLALLCAYPTRLMTEHDDARAVAEVCRLHTSVLGRYPVVPVPVGVLPDDAGRGAACGFPPDRGSPREARRFVLSQLGSLADRAVAADVAIVIAELAANAVLHARSAFTVAISHLPGTVRISVRDAVPLADGARLVTRPGHGLDLVAKVSTRWAVEPLPDGKVVWAELPLARATRIPPEPSSGNASP